MSTDLFSQNAPALTHFVNVAIPRPVDGLFTYGLNAEMAAQVQVGGWVKVPFGRKTIHAFVVEPPFEVDSEKAKASPIAEEKLKTVLEVGDGGAPIFSAEILELCRWAQSYYGSPLGEVLHCAAPPAAMGLRSTRREARKLKFEPAAAVFKHALTEAQSTALALLEEARKSGKNTQTTRANVMLLHGVTGSGKTELYAELARRTLAEGKGVLLLVPEIALTSQLHRRFEEGLGVPVGLWHSAVADGKRRDQLAALRTGELRVVVGARSAVFAPVENLGLIVIDEEHDSTYKQEDRVRYHARDLAIVRAKMNGAFVVLGSATPSLETRERVREGRYGIATLKERIAVGGLPHIEIVNLCEEERVENTQAPLAKKTLQVLQETLAAGEQAMVFLNRRGFAAFLVCQECGDVTGCPNCSISLTVHRKRGLLICHVCGHQERLPDFCYKCQGTTLLPMGAGTESLEEELPKWVEGVVPLRLDRDQVTSQKRLEKILEDFRERRANVLLGTQMLVKGHDFPGVTLVIVILADALFRWPDFRAPERAFQVLKQVSGRAGRGDRPGRVLIQTFDPDHVVLQAVSGILPEDQFLEGERELRQALGYPPFGRMLRLRFESAETAEARAHAEAVATVLQTLQTEGRYEVLGPSEAVLERAKGIYRWDVLIKATQVGAIQKAMSMARDLCTRNRWSYIVDVDPVGG
ncbi:primosomal protein N' [Bdellovibrionota bacterium FG-1]